MNIVTVMNYDWKDKNYLALCYMWIKQAELWLDKEDVCIIFSRKRLPKILLEKMKQSKTCKFKSVIHAGFGKQIYFPSGGAGHGSKVFGENYTYKFFIICSLNFSFVFLDADAVIVDSLDKMKEINLAQSKPLICINHEKIEGHTDVYPLFLNSGVMLVRDPKKIILNWNRIHEYGKNNRFVFRFKESNKIIPGTDQAVIKSYLDYINYDYTHKEMDESYNCCAENLNWFKNSAGRWQVSKKEKVIKILHYWHEFKPWQKSQSPIFQEVANDEVLNSFAFVD